MNPVKRLATIIIFVWMACTVTLSLDKCHDCLFRPDPSWGWCGNSSATGACYFGNENGPISDKCNDFWNFYICPPILNITVPIDLGLNIYDTPEVAADCFSNCTLPSKILPVESSNSVRLYFDNPIPIGFVVFQGNLNISVLFCTLSGTYSPVKFSFSIFDETLESSYTLNSTSGTSCVPGSSPSFANFSLKINSTSPIWKKYKYNTSNHSIEFSVDNDDMVLGIGSISVFMFYKRVDPDVIAVIPSLIPYCEDCPSTISTTSRDLAKFNYNCSFIRNKEIYTSQAAVEDTEDIVCLMPVFSDPPKLGIPDNVMFQLIPETGTDIQFNGINISFYVPPEILRILPPIGPLSGGTRVRIIGNGFFETTFLVVYMGGREIKDVLVGPEFVEFLTLPSVGNVSYREEVRLSMNGEYLSTNILYFMYENPPPTPPTHADPCHQCISNVENERGWCGADNHNGTCLPGNINGPTDSTCVSWNWHICPEQIEFKEFSLIHETIVNGSGRFCSAQPACALNRVNYTLFPQNSWANYSFSTTDLPYGAVIVNGSVLSKFGYCSTNPRNSTILLRYAVDNLPTQTVQISQFPSPTCLSNRFILSSQFLYFPENLWGNFRYFLSTHQFTLIRSAITPNDTKNYFQKENTFDKEIVSAALVSLVLNFDLYFIDPQITQIIPYAFPYCPGGCTYNFTILGNNFIKYKYFGVFDIFGLNQTTSPGIFVSPTQYNVPYVVSPSLPPPQNFPPVYLLDFVLTPFMEVETHGVGLKRFSLGLYEQPTMTSINPPSGFISGGTVVTLYGKGFFNDQGLEVSPRILMGSRVVGDVLLVNSSTLRFSTPPSTVNGTVDVKISLNGYTWSTQSLKYTYTSTPITPTPTPTPTPSPPPTPTPTPTPTPSSPPPPPPPPPEPIQPPRTPADVWVLDNWWIFLVSIFVILVGVCVGGILYHKFKSNKSVKVIDESTPSLGNIGSGNGFNNNNNNNNNDGNGAPFKAGIIKEKEGYQRIAEVDKTILARSFTIQPSEIHCKDVIGTGSFSTVYRGYYMKTEVAIKVIRSLHSRALKESLTEEAALMVNLRHPNIVAFMGACLQEPDLFIVTEYMPRGNLSAVLADQDVNIEPEHVRKFALDTCVGMNYLHSCNVIHRDLKTHNLLVDGNWNVKVSDFGLSRVIEDATHAQTLTACGTPSWAAPEVLKEDHFSLSADVYSFGVCLWEMCTREEPYKGLTAAQVVLKVVVKNERPDIPDIVPPLFTQIMQKCWEDNPRKRPTFTKLAEVFLRMSCDVPKHRNPYSKSGKSSKKLKGVQVKQIL